MFRNFIYNSNIQAPVISKNVSSLAVSSKVIEVTSTNPQCKTIIDPITYTTLSKKTISSYFKFSGKKQSLSRRYVYCSGRLLKTVQMAEVFPDSKIFVNKKLKFPVYDILLNFEKMVNLYGKWTPTNEAMKEFVADNFEDANDLEPWVPPDWKPQPMVMKKIVDCETHNWALELNTYWKHLGRKISEKVATEPKLYSIIPVPNGFLVPGETVTELYYWDTYWIVNGLFHCGMWHTARGMIENLIFLVSTYGYVPTGNRVYYVGRSHPPVLAMMLETYLKFTGDFGFIEKNINMLEKEMDYWKSNRLVTVRRRGFEYKLFRYNASISGPRPEAFKEDMQSGILASSPGELDEHFRAVKSATESGWEMSTRWFVIRGYNNGNRSNILTHTIIPVDLNAFMHKNYVLLSGWFKKLGNEEKAEQYRYIAEDLLNAIDQILWNEEQGIWLDYDKRNAIHRNYFYLSNLVPLWTMSYKKDPKEITEYVVNYLTKHDIDTFQGGIPASLEDSGEKWDFPTTWPPLLAYLVQGLDRLCTKPGEDLAFHFANKFVKTIFKGFENHKAMFEAYDCLQQGRYGLGISHDKISSKVYGWTNGVLFEFLDRWGDKIKIKDDDTENEHCTMTHCPINIPKSNQKC